SRVDNFFVAITLKYAKSVKDCLEEIDEVSRENKDIKQICAILSIMHHYHNDQRVCVIYDLVPLYMLALLNNTIHREPWVAMLLLNLRIGYETNKMAVWAMLKFVSVDKNIAGALRNLELEYLQAGGFDENVRELAAAMHANMGEIWNVQEFVALAKECKASCIEFTKRFCKEWELIKSGRVKEDEIKMLRKKIKIPYEPIARKLYDYITKKIVANNVSEAQIHSVLDVVVSGFDAFANSLTQLTGLRPDFSKEQLQELYNKIV
ncbi:MAG: hypothetical protein K2Q33_08540, partial [Gammaproteobacteria bacterium]|nr:hypothetical protein [Gammaproteobacteria bacterium]